MLEISGLSAHYGAVTALTDVTLSVGRGQIVSLLGSNGAGKSTLLGCITNSVSCQMTGSIKLEGTEISRMPTNAIIARGLVLVPEGRQLFAELTVEENLRMGAYGVERGRHWRNDLERVYALFPALVERRRQTASTLSGGEQQMVAIGRAIMGRPRIMLLDEPSLGLCATTSQGGLHAGQGNQPSTGYRSACGAERPTGARNCSTRIRHGKRPADPSAPAKRLMQDQSVVSAYLGIA